MTSLNKTLDGKKNIDKISHAQLIASKGSNEQQHKHSQLGIGSANKCVKRDKENKNNHYRSSTH